MDIKALVHLGCARVAIMIKGKSPEEIRNILGGDEIPATNTPPEANTSSTALNAPLLTRNSNTEDRRNQKPVKISNVDVRGVKRPLAPPPCPTPAKRARLQLSNLSDISSK